MLSEKFLKIIDQSKIGKYISNKQKIIEGTDPERIYIENLRGVFNLPYNLTKFFCELAVKEKLFRKRIAVTCPNEACGRIIKSYAAEEEIEDSIECEQCMLLEKEKFAFSTQELKKIVFYQLVK